MTDYNRTAPIAPPAFARLFSVPAGAVNLGLGEPNFDPPEHVAAALRKAVEEGRNHYSPPPGLPPLREAVAARLAPRTGWKADNVLVTSSGTHAIYTALQTLAAPGDEVLIPDPGWPLYGPQVVLAGARPVPYTLRDARAFSPEPDDVVPLITERTKVLILNSPSNPTGGVNRRDDVEALLDAARRRGAWVISDEVYDRLTYGVPHETLLGRYENLVYVNSFSKTYALTGWRLGYLAGPDGFVAEAAKVLFYSVACAPEPFQHAALAALTGPQDAVERMAAEFARRRELVVSRLKRMPGISVVPPAGAFYCFPSFRAGMPSATGVAETWNRSSMESTEFAAQLAKRNLIVSPGTAFGRAGEGHIRISFAASDAALVKGMDILASLCEGTGVEK